MSDPERNRDRNGELIISDHQARLAAEALVTVTPDIRNDILAAAHRALDLMQAAIRAGGRRAELPVKWALMQRGREIERDIEATIGKATGGSPWNITIELERATAPARTVLDAVRREVDITGPTPEHSSTCS